MRIGNPGGGQGGFSGFGRRRDRTADFRKRYRVGDTVRGRLARWESDGLAWVTIDDQPLLTQIHSRHEPGTWLTFEVQQVAPEILLREKRGGGGGGEGGRAGLLQEYNAARTHFESVGFGLLRSLSPRGSSPGQRRAALFEALSSAEDAVREAYVQVMARNALINARLAPGGPARFFYQPWLLPSARQVELLVRTGPTAKGKTPLMESVLGLELPRLGQVQIRSLGRGGEFGCRIYVARTSQARKILRFLSAHAVPGADLLGVEALPKFAHAGLLAELMLPSVHDIAGFSLGR